MKFAENGIERSIRLSQCNERRAELQFRQTIRIVKYLLPRLAFEQMTERQNNENKRIWSGFFSPAILVFQMIN